MCWINLCSLTWEAAATLLTGLLAVTAASVIGLRQTDLAAVATRVELFERRYAVYQAARNYLIAAQVNLGEMPTGDVERDFREARSRARFLFGSKGTENMALVSEVVARFVLARRQFESAIQRGAPAHAEADKEHEALVRLFEMTDELATLFEADLNLADDLRPFLSARRK